MTLGQKIKELRAEKNWKQDNLAKELGVDVRQISLYENNRNAPYVETVIKIAQVFNVSIDYLLIDDYPRRPLYIKDSSFISRFTDLESLKKDEKDALLKIMDCLIYKNKIESALNTVK